MRLCALISSYREGDLLEGAWRSGLATGAEAVFVLEAPIRPAKERGDEPPVQRPHALVFERGRAYGSDAQKRTALLHSANADRYEWAVVIDGDEVLMHPEHLRAQIARAVAEHESRGQEAIAMPLRIVESDGSVGLTFTRVLRVEAFTRYVNSSNVLELAGGEVVAASNQKLCGPGGWPEDLEQERTPDQLAAHLAVYRGPVGGEPYLWHRPMWRPVARGVERQHEAETRTWQEFRGGALDSSG